MALAHAGFSQQLYTIICPGAFQFQLKSGVIRATTLFTFCAPISIRHFHHHISHSHRTFSFPNSQHFLLPIHHRPKLYINYVCFLTRYGAGKKPIKIIKQYQTHHFHSSNTHFLPSKRDIWRSIRFIHISQIASKMKE